MRRFAVAFPAQFPRAMAGVLTGHLHQGTLIHQVGMTANAVFLEDGDPGLFHMDHLRLKPEGKHERVTQPIARLEGELADHIILRNMAIVANGKTAMTPPLPCGILRGHDMAIHTCCRFIGQIRGCIGGAKDHQAQSAQDSHDQEYGEFPLFRGNDEIEELEKRPAKDKKVFLHNDTMETEEQC